MKEYYDSWTDGHRHRSDNNNTINRRKKYLSDNKRKIAVYSGHGGDLFKSKSKSLDVIIEEIYLSGIQDSIEARRNLEAGNRPSLIPRIKLSRSASNLRKENFLFQMSTTENFENSSQQGGADISDNEELQEGKGLKSEKYNINEESSGKRGQNYFSEDSNEGGGCLQLTENNNCMPHDKVFEEREERVNGHVFCVEKKINLPENSRLHEPELEHGGIQLGNDNNKTNEFMGITVEFEGKFSGTPNSNATVVDRENLISEKPDEDTAVNLEGQRGENNQSISEWYNGLKQQFEKTGITEGNKSKEMSCRITGATLKKSNGTTEEDKGKDTKLYFSRLVKNNRALIDEELPDPDKVKTIRAMFQENSNATLKRNLYQALSGSLQNISVKAPHEHYARPMSAQCNRDDIICGLLDNDGVDKKIEMRSSNTSLSETPKASSPDLMKEFMSENAKQKFQQKMTRDFRSKKLLQPKWTDTGSISSGVSSDLSSFDTDVENFSKEYPEVEAEDVVISDDDYLYEDKDKHFVENEFLEKIRSFGTTVTYYGGEMINCSVGPILSPTAIAIMNEINEKYGHKGSITKSFAEFYRKYVEINEPHTMRKLGKSKSFGQSDVFQKPNVMNNNEIELYKNDLETEIGIRKPSGISSNTLKRSLHKSKNEGCHKNTCDTAQSSERSSSPSLADSFAKVEVVNNADNFIEHKETQVEAVKCEAEEQTDYLQQSDTAQSIPRNENVVGTFIEMEIKMAQSEVELEDNCTKQEIHKTKESHGEIKSDYFESTPKEILFGYEKKLLNGGKRQSDMEFEEFEVCNSISEKIDQSETAPLENSDGSEKTLEKEIPTNPNIEIIITEEPLQPEEENEKDSENVTLKEVESQREEVKAEPVPPRKWNINLNEIEGSTVQNEKAVELNNEIRERTEKKEGQNNPRENGFAYDGEENRNFSADYDCGKNNRNNYRNKHLRWPIETTVVVDIQKETENTPKIITNGKISSKPKKRLF